jgi:ketosteroid isomerase-like protein
VTSPVRPDAAMMPPVRAVAAFMATLDDAALADCFADDVVIVENFAPYVFRGPGAVARWRAGFRDHAATLSGLVITFGTAQDFSSDGETAYFALPTRWTGKSDGQAFEEDGGWAFVLKKQGRNWHIACYAWAVTALRRV